MRTIKVELCALTTVLALCLAAGGANAAGPVELGGKLAFSSLVQLLSNSATDDNMGSISFDGSYILKDGHNEFGAGLNMLGIFGGEIEFGIYILRSSYRFNFTPIGPDQNIVFFVGADLGVAIFAGDGIDTEASASGGPKFGVEYYFTPKVALQIQDTITIAEDYTDDGVVALNLIALGVRVLF